MGKPRVDAHDALGTGQRGGRRRQSGPRSHFGAGNGPDQTLHALALDVAAPEENASEACAGELAAQMRPVLLGPELFVTARIDGQRRIGTGGLHGRLRIRLQAEDGPFGIDLVAESFGCGHAVAAHGAERCGQIKLAGIGERGDRLATS